MDRLRGFGGSVVDRDRPRGLRSRGSLRAVGACVAGVADRLAVLVCRDPVCSLRSHTGFPQPAAPVGPTPAWTEWPVDGIVGSVCRAGPPRAPRAALRLLAGRSSPLAIEALPASRLRRSALRGLPAVAPCNSRDRSPLETDCLGPVYGCNPALLRPRKRGAF